MPPNGAPAWHHTEDVWVSSDERGTTFVELTIALDGQRARWSMPCIGSPFDSFFVLGFARAPDGRSVVVERYGPEGIVQTPWTGASLAEQLLPPSYRDVLPRRPAQGPSAGAAPIAHLRMSAAGAIELLDSSGRVRSAVWRSDGAPAEAAAFGPSLEACGGSLRAAMLVHEGTRVVKRESSMP